MTIIFYKSTSVLLRRPQYRWRLEAANRRTLGASSESFNNRADCTANAELVTDCSRRGVALDVRW